ncbi:hypothetical protein [Paracraurococcus ruber]|uniref:hypothetical protein n=1 Tax=Paracraurococcus ruber TaxID=77675 RepID=UPI0013050795|nr:hypothetical protein [Paracraurococcus ruber]
MHRTDAPDRLARLRHGAPAAGDRLSWPVAALVIALVSVTLWGMIALGLRSLIG